MEDFISWLGETNRSISHPGQMAVEFSLPDDIEKLVEAYKADRGFNAVRDVEYQNLTGNLSGTFACGECGAVCWDMRQHDAYHQKLEDLK